MSVDYAGNYLVNEFDPNATVDSLNIPKELLLKLEKWNEEYTSNIPTGGLADASISSEYDHFDNRGIALAQEVISVIQGGAKIKYYSEGKSIFFQVA